MDYGVAEDENLVANKNVMNVKGGSLHGITIYKGCVFVEVQNSEHDEYIFSKV